MDPATGKGGIFGEDENIERIAVFGKCVGNEAVFGRVRGGREETSIKPDSAGFVIDLVLVAASSGYLDHDVDGFHSFILPAAGSL